MKKLLSGSIALGVALFAARAEAQSTPANVLTAQVLFDEAKALTKKGDFAAACPKFVESHRLDPAGGTILHAADCHQSEGKLATAWTEYNAALSLAIRDRRSDREKIAREQIAALSPRIGKLTITVPAEARAIEALAITLDESTLERAGWDHPIPLDKGKHTLTVSAPGRTTLRAETTVQDGVASAFTVGVPKLEETAPAKAPASVSIDPGPSPPAPAADRDSGGSRRTLGLIAAGAGVVGLGIGSVFGIRALSIGDQSQSCTLGPSKDGCPQSAVDEQSSARSAATVSTIGFIAGAALLAGGAVLYFTAPKAPARAAIVPIPYGGALMLRGDL